MLDGILESLGLVRISRYDALKELYVAENITRTNLQRRLNQLEDNHARADFEGKARYASPDGKKVLKDLQRALNYLKEYQRAMWVVLAPDNNYYLVKELLEAWGMVPDSGVNDHYARGNQGIPKRDRTGQDYDSYGVTFIHDEDEDGERLTYANLPTPQALLDSSSDD